MEHWRSLGICVELWETPWKLRELRGALGSSDADGSIFSEDSDLLGLDIAASDMDGDGKDDLWIGSPFYDGDAGRASLYVMP